MKKVLSLLLSLCLLVAFVTPALATGNEVPSEEAASLTWTLSEDGVFTISGKGAMEEYSLSATPWYEQSEEIKSVVIEDGVTSISFGAFYYCQSLESVTIPDSVTSIGTYAFYNCESLESITIPAGVTSIDDFAFEQCSSLTKITVDPNNAVYSSDEHGVLFNKDKTELIMAPGAISGSYAIPGSVTSIGASAFYCCTELVSVTIPESVTTIGSSVFYNCTSLTSVTIPDGVTRIYEWMFYNCESLESVTIPANVTDIRDHAFGKCTSLEKVIYLGTEEQWNKISISSDNDALTNANIEFGSEAPDEPEMPVTWKLSEDGVLTISGKGEMEEYEVYATPWYEQYEAIKSVVIEDGVTSISFGAFYGCKSLESVTIPDSVTSIGDHAFTACTSLKSVTIPDSVTSIGDLVFRDCESLTKITVDPNNTAYSSDESGVLFNKDKTELIMAPGAISGSYIIPNSVTSIGYYAFYNCTSLKSVTIPDSVTSIGAAVFNYCTSLESVTIPDSVTSIGDNAFMDCESLTKITVDPNNTAYSSDESGVLFNKDKTELIMAPVVISGSYIIPNSVTSIDDNAFYCCTSLESVTIPDSVTSIGDSAFTACTSLESVTIPKSVTSIGDYAFYYCISLESVTFKGDAPEFGANAFYYVTATAYYPAGNSTWNEATLIDHGGTITWEIGTAAVIGDVAYATFAEAMAAARSGDTVKLCADAEITEVIIPSGVTLDIGTYTLTADYLVGLNGSKLTATTIKTSGIDGKLFVDAKNFALPEKAPVDSGYEVVPLFDPTLGCYRFARFEVTTTGTNRGLKVTEADEENGVESKIYFQFVVNTTTYIRENLVGDGMSDNDVKVVIHLEWNTTEGVASQDFVYNEDQIKAIFGGGQEFAFTMKGYEALGIIPESLRVSGRVVSGSKVVAQSPVWGINGEIAD